MNGERIEQAVRRIETALARIADAAEAVHPTQTSVAKLVADHAALREATDGSIEALDELIARIGK